MKGGFLTDRSSKVGRERREDGEREREGRGRVVRTDGGEEVRECVLAAAASWFPHSSSSSSRLLQTSFTFLPN